jgi:hypothetical protein
MSLTKEQLGLILQASRDFALKQLSQAGGFIPFATRAMKDGEIDFIRLGGDDVSDDKLEEIFMRTQESLQEQAGKGEILAAATVANVQLKEGEGGGEFERAIQVHVEADAFSRVILVPYRFPAMELIKTAKDVETGEMIPFDAPSVVFSA